MNRAIAGPLAAYALIPFAWGVAATVQGNLFSLDIEVTPIISLAVGGAGLITAALLNRFGRA